MAKLDDTLKSVNHQKNLVILQNTIDIFFMIKNHKKNIYSVLQND